MVTDVQIYDNPISDASDSTMHGARLVTNGITDTKVRKFFDMAQSAAENSSEAESTRGKKESALYENTDDGFFDNDDWGKQKDDFGIKEGKTYGTDMVEDIFWQLNEDEETGALASRVFEVVRDLGIKVGFRRDMAFGKGGESRNDNTVTYNLRTLETADVPRQKRASILLHELIHNATMYAIRAVERGNEVSPELREAVKELNDLYESVKEDESLAGEYGITEPIEMVAEASNPTFRAKLKKIGLWQRLVNAVKGVISGLLNRDAAIREGIFGKAERISADEALRQSLDKFLNNFDRETYNWYHGIRATKTNDDFFDNDDWGKESAYYKLDPVEDKELIKEIEKDGTFRMFSGMQMRENDPYSPMAAFFGKKKADAAQKDTWDASEEHPELATPVIDKKTGKQATYGKGPHKGEPAWEFNLVKTDETVKGKKKAGEGDVPAAYNPYNHLSSAVLNDQFTGAYARGNIVVAEWDVPRSELYSGYHAEKAKDDVGVLPWHSGSVNGLLPKHRQRSVMLSRYRRLYRIVPDEEVAQALKYSIEGTDLAIPWNVVTPNQLRELVKLGIRITTVPTGTQGGETVRKFKSQMAELKKEFPDKANFVDVKMTKDDYKEWGIGTDDGKGREKIKLGETFSKDIQSFDNVRDRAVRETGIVLPNLATERVKVVDVPQHDFSPRNGKTLIEAAEDWAKEHLATKQGEELPTMRDGTSYSISNKAIEKYLSESSILKSDSVEVHLNVLAKLKDVIKESIEAEIHPDYHKNKVGDRKTYMGHTDNVLVHRLYGAVSIDGKLYRVKTTMQEFRGNNPNRPHSYEVTKIELLDPHATEVLPNSRQFGQSTNSITGAKLLQKVGKSYEPWKDLLDESQTLTNGKRKFSLRRGKTSNGTGLVESDESGNGGWAQTRYDKEMSRWSTRFREAWQDSMVSVKEAQELVLAERGESMTDAENAYAYENQMHGINRALTEHFQRNLFTPMVERFRECEEALGMRERSLMLYLMCKHGLERNAVFAERDGRRKYADIRKKVDAFKADGYRWRVREYTQANPNATEADILANVQELTDADVFDVHPEWDVSEDECIAANFGKDYSGLTAIAAELYPDGLPERQSLTDAINDVGQLKAEVAARAHDLEDARKQGLPTAVRELELRMAEAKLAQARDVLEYEKKAQLGYAIEDYVGMIETSDTENKLDGLKKCTHIQLSVNTLPGRRCGVPWTGFTRRDSPFVAAHGGGC